MPETIIKTEAKLKAKKEIHCQTLKSLGSYSGSNVVELIKQIQDQQQEISNIEAQLAEAKVDLNIFQINSLREMVRIEITALVSCHSSGGVSAEEKKHIASLIELKRREYLEITEEIIDLKTLDLIEERNDTTGAASENI